MDGSLKSEPEEGGRPRGWSAAKTWARALAATAGLNDQSLGTLPNIIDEIAEQLPDAPALLSSTSCFTYKQLAELSHRYARWALAEDVLVGDVVCLLMKNRPEYLAIWLGITQVGGVVALLNPNLTGAALTHCVRLAAPKHVIIDISVPIADLGSLAGAPRIWNFGEAASMERIEVAVEKYSGQRLSRTEQRPVTLSNKALLIYTSGTTGLPKAAVVSHFRAVTWSRWFAGIMDAGPDDRMYDCLPLYHSVGGIVATGALLVSGGSVVIREKFSTKGFWRDIRETESTLFQYIGELCRYLINEAPSADDGAHNLRLCCGNGLRADVWEIFESRFKIPKIIEFYAATEGTFSLYNVEGRIGAIGRVPAFLAHRFPVTLVVYDPVAGEPARNARGHCIKAGPDEVGEAIGAIGGDGSEHFGSFEGYTDEGETERKILRNVFAHGDVWFRTGDLMRRDTAGFFYFVDRLGDTFRWKGENVATLEVEEMLSSCVGVRDAVVYGVAVANCEGRAGMAALVIDDQFDLEIFRRHCEAVLPEYARPVFIRLAREITMTETFKHKKNGLVEEGFDPRRATNPLYFYDRIEKAYLHLDEGLFTRIDQGGTRL